ncbi:hypothetical protein K2Z83_13405 [Oscillochloris sp. ZM17-4]|uniref:hypothetical protein n=1 Tax=Oscillochloris sp. ZM17-4 TaxID=2866714 RepID=UPI001C72A63E|nr:hypothetical protein [Oscillochloris sp. ZM17-4]MBX0328673.1 hypothetical protein [Oscillochloris sp. ZM17-4]
MSTDLRIEYTPLASLLPAARNAKLHDEPGIRASILRFGFAEPLTINEATGRLVAGHGRLIVLNKLKAEGAKAPARITVKGKDWLVPVVRGLSFASEAEADAYLIGANQLTINGGWNESLLLETIADLAKVSGGFAGTGLAQGTIDKALAEFSASAASFAEAMAPAPVAAPTPASAAPAPAAAAAAPAPVAAAPIPVHVAVDDGALGMGFGAGGEGDTAEDNGILDPIDRSLTKGENANLNEAVRFMRYAIPLTVEESAALEAAVEDWVHQTGGLFGFIRNLLKQAGRI